MDDKEQTLLQSVLSPVSLHPSVAAKFNGQLPFLFKVLSIAKALSIQAHPDKTLAERLHAERPQVYKDDNHKPEMAIALTEFEGLCGFRPLEEIAAALKDFPELAVVVGQDVADGFFKKTSLNETSSRKAALKSVFKVCRQVKKQRRSYPLI